MSEHEPNRDFSAEVHGLIQLIESNAKDSENGLGQAIKSIDMHATEIGKQVVDLKRGLESTGLNWQDAGATKEEARYLDDLFHGEVGQ